MPVAGSIWEQKSALFLIALVYSPGARAENPLGTNFWCQQQALITLTICCKFQTNLFELLILYTFFKVCPHVYSPRAGADNPLWTKFWCQQKGFVTLPTCCKFQKFWCQQKGFVPLPTCCKFQKNIFELLIVYAFFNVCPYVYSPGAGADNPLWTKFWCQQKGLVTLLTCYKFQKNIFEV